MARTCACLVGILLTASLSFSQPPPQASPFQPAAPRENAQAKQAGTATIRGHVVAADSGQPLRKAQVRIMSLELRENRLATADGDGKFEFKEVRPGRYNVTDRKSTGLNSSPIPLY